MCIGMYVGPQEVDGLSDVGGGYISMINYMYVPKIKAMWCGKYKHKKLVTYVSMLTCHVVWKNKHESESWKVLRGVPESEVPYSCIIRCISIISTQVHIILLT